MQNKIAILPTVPYICLFDKRFEIRADFIFWFRVLFFTIADYFHNQTTE